MAFPPDAIAKLTGVQRQLAETMIVLRPEAWDARVPDALVTLDAAWTAPSLTDLANSTATQSELRVALADAAREFTTP